VQHHFRRRVLRIGGTASDIGYVATAELIPVIAVLLLGGVIADWLPRHQAIVAANALQALAQGTSAALVLTGHAHVWQLAALAAAGGAGIGFYYPAGPGWGLAIDAASFAIAGALRIGMRFPGLPPARAPSVLHDLREGWQEFTSRRWLWTIVAQFAVVVAVSAATINVLGPLVAHLHLGGARSWGFIVAALPPCSRKYRRKSSPACRPATPSATTR
jgi:hypothetical protein